MVVREWHVDMCFGLRRFFYLEQSREKGPNEGIFLGIKDESEIAVVGTPHGIVMTADENLNQRVQIAEDRTVEATPLKQQMVNEILYQSQHERRSDSRSELKNKHLRVRLVKIHRQQSNHDAPSIQVDESNEDRSKRQKVTHGADVELEGLGMESERDRLQRYSDCDFLMQVKQNVDVYLGQNLFQ